MTQVPVDPGVHTARLLTDDPAGRAGLEGCGPGTTGRVPLSGEGEPTR
ncbi:hypothetical protein ACI78V_04315 [Geodermatophilus sp. SYSU D00742]